MALRGVDSHVPNKTDASAFHLHAWAKWLVILAAVAFTMQLCGLLVWNGIEIHHDDLTWDYAIFSQAAWLLVHGFWNPFVSVAGIFFWQNHDEWIMWPLSQLTRIVPFSVWAPVVQDVSAVGANVVAWLWMEEILVQRQLSHRSYLFFSLLGLGLLVATPWIFWANG
ncbi:MAG: hypothetical protein OWS74_07170, partial [Firmicutes bacterium]|nr:hypothetical protein [Bacillota bacterium]